MAERLEASPGTYLAIFSAVYFLGQACANSRRYFWFDELMTYYLAELPSIGQILPMIRRGIEFNPPLPFWITWVVHHAIGGGEVVSRMPAVTGFWLLCFCLFHFVRRRSDVVYGFVAFLLPLFTYTAWDATWARGYGLLLGFSAAALLCWQLAADGVGRVWSLAGLAASIALAVSCHYYAVYVAGALGLGEIVRTFDRKRFDFGIWAAFAAGLTPMLGYVALVRMASAATHSFWVSPQAKFVYQSYADLLGPGAMAAMLLVALSLRAAGTENGGDWRPATLARHEVVVCLVLVAMPLTVFLCSLVFPIAFYTRYVQPVVIGFAVIVSLFLYRMGGGNPKFRNLTISVVVWAGMLPWAAWQFGKLAMLAPARVSALALLKMPENSDLPIVVNNDDESLTLNHYGSPELRSRLFALTDARAAIEYDIPQLSLAIAQSFRDLHAVDYHQFLRDHREFLLARMHPGGWIFEKLLADGADIRLVRLEKGRGLVTDDSQLFRVRIPDSMVAGGK